MSLVAEIRAVVRDSLKSFDDLQTKHTYIDADGSPRVYDPVSDTYTGGPVTHADIPMLIVGYESKDVDGSVILKNDKKAIIASLDLPVAAPAASDSILLSDGEWKVQSVRSDPAGAAWVLQIRLVGA